jgi:hypothetical protein
MFAKRTELMLSVLRTKGNKTKQAKEDNRKEMDLLMTLIITMIS